MILFLVLMAFGLRFYRLGGQSLWFDESYTVLVARMPFRLGMEFLLADGVHPPLFYWIEKAFLRLGAGEWTVRLPAMLVGVLGVGAIYLAAEAWLGRSRAGLAALLLALSPFHLWYSQDARMYTLLALWAVVCMWGYVRLLERPGLRDCIFFTLASGLAYLTHYFALFLPLIQFVHLVVHLKRYPRQLRVWTGLQVAASLSLWGWIYLLSRREVQHFGIGWIPPASLEDLAYTLVNFTIGYTPPVSAAGWAAAGAMAVLVLWGARQMRADGSLRTLLLLWAFLPPLLILLISARRPTYVDRFFILALPAFLILMAAGIAGLGRRRAALVGLAVVGVFSWRAAEVLSVPQGLIKEEWRQAAAFLEAEVGEDEIVVPRLLQIAVPLSYYLEDGPAIHVMEVNREVTPLQEIVKGYNGAWLVYWNASAEAHALAAQAQFDLAKEGDPAAGAWLRGEGPEILERKDFVGITVFHFGLTEDLNTKDTKDQ